MAKGMRFATLRFAGQSHGSETHGRGGESSYRTIREFIIPLPVETTTPLGFVSLASLTGGGELLGGQNVSKPDRSIVSKQTLGS